MSVRARMCVHVITSGPRDGGAGKSGYHYALWSLHAHLSTNSTQAAWRLMQNYPTQLNLSPNTFAFFTFQWSKENGFGLFDNDIEPTQKPSRVQFADHTTSNVPQMPNEREVYKGAQS